MRLSLLRPMWLLVLMLVLALTLSWSPVIATATASAQPDIAVPSGKTAAAEEPGSETAAAMETARATDHRVEDVSQRSQTTMTFANPDGTWTAETYSEPVRVQDTAGDWHDIDTTLVAKDGGLAPKYAASDVVLSDGGDKTFAAMTEDGKELGWKWPTTLPAPLVDGNTATYKNVVAGGDLVVTADATGFTHDIVLNQRPTGPVDFSTPIVGTSLDVSETDEGGLSIETSSGHDLVAAAQPLMYDSSEDEIGEPQVQDVDTAVTQTNAATATVTLSPDEDFLSDPDTVYPVTVDPSYSSYTSADTYVQNLGYTSGQGSADDLRAGSYDGGTHTARSFLHFDTSAPWMGKHVTKATFVLRNWQSLTCHGSPIRVRPMSEDWSAADVTWVHQPEVGDAFADFSPAYGTTGGTCPNADASWNVTSMVSAWSQSPSTNFGLRVAAVDPTDNDSWRRYRSANYGDPGEPVRPHIDVTYNTAPLAPSNLRVTPSANGVVTSLTPSLSALLTDPDGGQVTGNFSLLSPDGDVIWSGSSPAVPSGGVATVAIPDGTIGMGDKYVVKAAVTDGTDLSSAVSSSTFTATADTTTTPAAACVSPCTSIPDTVVYDTSGKTQLAAGESRIVSVSVPAIADMTLVDRLSVRLLVKNWTKPGTVALSDPDYPASLAPTASYGAGSPAAGLTTTAEATLSSDSRLRITNTGTAPVDMRLTAFGWYNWFTPDEQAIADTENGADDPDTTTDPVDDGVDDPDSIDSTDPSGVVIDGQQSPQDQASSRAVAPDECGSPMGGQQACMTPATDAEYDASLNDPDFAQADLDGDLSARLTAGQVCPFQSNTLPWKIFSRFNACRHFLYRVVNIAIPSRRVIGTAYVVLVQKLHVDGKSDAVKDTYRYLLRSVSGTISSVTINTGMRCIFNCDMDGQRSTDTVSLAHPISTWRTASAQNNNGQAKNTIEYPLTALTLSVIAAGQPAATDAVGQRFRCDNMAYLPGNSMHCVFHQYPPDIPFSLRGKYPNSTAVMARGQRISPSHPGRRGDGQPLTRHYWYPGETNLNRNAAKKQCRDEKRVGESCDEYPYASTYQGCADHPCRTNKISGRENSLAGSALGRWYGQRRVIDGDEFFVKILG